MTDAQNKEIVKKVLDHIPSTEEIVTETVESFQKGELDTEYFITNFSKLVVQLEEKAHQTYREHAEKALPYAIDLWMKNNQEMIKELEKLPFDESARELCTEFLPFAIRLEFSLGQSRKSRAGQAFELVVSELLNKIGIPCEKPHGKEPKKDLKRIDLVVPNQETALTKADKSYYLSCKRTLRERWKQTIPERKPSWRVFILTIDTSLSEEKANEFNKLGMYVYIVDELKQKDHLKNKEWVRRLADLPHDLVLSEEFRS